MTVMDTNTATATLTWHDVDAATYTAEQTVVNGHTVTVCLDDEGPMSPAFYWDIDNRAVDGWASTIDQARIDAVQTALDMEPGDTVFCTAELTDVAERLTGYGTDAIEIERDGFTYRFTVETDDTESVMDHVNGCDTYGKLSFGDYNRETGRWDRPADFDGSARKIPPTNMHDEVWWMPYREGHTVYGSDDEYRFVRELLDFGFVGYTVEATQTCRCCDRDCTVGDSALWGIEHPMTHSDRRGAVPHVTEVLGDLVSDVSAQIRRYNSGAGKPDNMVRDDDYRDHAGAWHCGWCNRVGNTDPVACGWCGIRRETSACMHCDRPIVKDDDEVWVDPYATGDDSVWRETCDRHDTMVANHEPSTTDTTTTTTTATTTTTTIRLSAVHEYMKFPDIDDDGDTEPLRVSHWMDPESPIVHWFIPTADEDFDPLEGDERIVVELPVVQAARLIVDWPGAVWDYSEGNWSTIDYRHGIEHNQTLFVDADNPEMLAVLWDIVKVMER